jgi:twitching motility two-component system response regulator PilG
VVAENIHSEKFLQGENSALIRRVSSLLARDLSIRHLAMRLNKDELDVAQILHSGLINKTLSLKEPSPPFNKFPTIPEPREQVFQEKPEITESSSTGSGRTARKRYTIFCVDDNVSILEAISDMLPEEDFNFVSTTDPIQALMEINKITPDLILLDIEMPDLNGHKICHLFRHKRALRDVPIIMVTAKKGLVDRTVAKIKGASAYLTKPFTKKDLHTLLFQYLN